MALIVYGAWTVPSHPTQDEFMVRVASCVVGLTLHEQTRLDNRQPIWQRGLASKTVVSGDERGEPSAFQWMRWLHSRRQSAQDNR